MAERLRSIRGLGIRVFQMLHLLIIIQAGLVKRFGFEKKRNEREGDVSTLRLAHDWSTGLVISEI